MASPIEPFLEATVRTATPLALAALGEAVTERAGLINIGLEGAIVAGAFGALIGAGAAGAGAGFAAAAVAGAAVAAIFAVFTLWLRADQIGLGLAAVAGAAVAAHAAVSAIKQARSKGRNDQVSDVER